MVLAGGGAAEAGKKRRNATLEALRQRNATERWRQLQEQWPARPGDGNEVPAPVTSTSSTSDPTAEQPVGVRRTAEAPSPGPTLGQEDVPQVRLPPLPGASISDAGTVAEPVSESTSPRSKRGQTDAGLPWVIPPTAGDLSGAKRDATTLVNLYQPGQSTDSEARPERQPDSEALPKPISDILPYYDYSPIKGDKPCEVLCPRPEGCPEDMLAKPCPDLTPLPESPFQDRTFAETHVTWEASNLFSNPLYFEDAPLERYGHTHGQLLQPLVSLGKFGVQFVGLPYQMALHPIHEHRYALGWYRPGELAPYKYYLPPWNRKAALTAGAVYTGLIFVIP